MSIVLRVDSQSVAAVLPPINGVAVSDLDGVPDHPSCRVQLLLKGHPVQSACHGRPCGDVCPLLPEFTDGGGGQDPSDRQADERESNEE